MTGRHVGARRALRILGLVFLPLGIAGAIAAGVFWFVESGSARSAHADGIVVSAGVAVVTFKTPDGRPHRFQSRSRSSLWHVGDPVRVAYDPAAPDDAQIESIAGRWVFVTIFGIIGAVFVVMGAGMILASRILKSRAPST
jgi:hypothetical protein